MKSKKLIIETPEKIIFTYNIAEIGSRVAAYLIDSLIQLAVLIILVVFAELSVLSFDAFGDDQALYYAAILYILLFFFQWGYFVFFETVMNGRTPGKKACHIRVIRFNGERLDFQCLVIRNLLRAADSIPFPFFNFLGGLVAIIHKKNKRLGDIVAGTIVVTDSVFNLNEPDFETALTSKTNSFFINSAGKGMLNEKDLYILRKLINGRSSMTEESATRTAAAIVAKLEKRYDLSTMKGKSDFMIIEEIYKAHTYENKK